MNDLFGITNWLYETNGDNTARYVLGQKGINPLFCIGVNPSTAEPGKLDPTLKAVKRFTKHLSYDGWVMFNLYPQRATNPKDLGDDLCILLQLNNITSITECIKRHRCYGGPLNIWAAWGALITKRDYLAECLKQIVQNLAGLNVNWINIGPLTKDGHPRHPLYLPNKSEVSTFDMVNYLKGKRDE